MDKSKAKKQSDNLARFIESTKKLNEVISDNQTRAKKWSK